MSEEGKELWSSPSQSAAQTSVFNTERLQVLVCKLHESQVIPHVNPDPAQFEGKKGAPNEKVCYRCIHYNTFETERQQDLTLRSTDFMDSNSNTVVVTGFGPFRQYLVNSSWEAVKELSKRGLGENIALRILQLPVVYQKAKEQVFKIWTTLHPLLTVHVGLASSTKAIIILEQCGKNKGYQEMDVCGFHPEGGCCMLDGPEKIESTINMKTLWKNISVEGIDIIFSRDAGRYICDYTYYTSLYYGNGRAVLIHVPPLSQSVTADFLGKALQTIILEMLKQCGEERE